MAFVAFCPRRRGVYVLVALAAIVAIARLWPAPEVTPPPAATWQLVPLAGEPLHAAVDRADGEYEDGSGWVGASGPCVPFLAELVTRPGWMLQIRERASGCTGTENGDVVAIDAIGRAVIERPGLPMLTTHVTQDELARVRALADLSCVRSSQGYGYGELFYELGWGTTAAGDGAHIAASSELGEAITELVATLRLRAAEAMFATTPFTLRARFRQWYDDDRRPISVAIDAGGMLTVQRGREVLVREAMDPVELADLADAIVAGHLTEDDRDLELLTTGSAVIDGERYPIRLFEFTSSRQAQLITGAVARAIWRGR
jgi:hypothetical protein